MRGTNTLATTPSTSTRITPAAAPFPMASSTRPVKAVYDRPTTSSAPSSTLS